MIVLLRNPMWMRSDFQEFSPVCPITPAAIQLSLCRTLSGTAGSPGNNPTTSDIPMWEYADSISTIHGRHTFSMGFDFRTWVQKRDLSTNFLGSFTFNNTTVARTATTEQTTARPLTAAQAMQPQTFFWVTAEAQVPSSLGHSARPVRS